jgi:hypothetical protein
MEPIQMVAEDIYKLPKKCSLLTVAPNVQFVGIKGYVYLKPDKFSAPYITEG